MTPLEEARYAIAEPRPPRQPTRRRFSTFGYIRCECRHCCAESNGLAFGDVLTGVCGTCGGTDITPVSD